MRKNNSYLYKRMRSFLRRLFRKKNKTQKKTNNPYESVDKFRSRLTTPNRKNQTLKSGSFTRLHGKPKSEKKSAREEWNSGSYNVLASRASITPYNRLVRPGSVPRPGSPKSGSYRKLAARGTDTQYNKMLGNKMLGNKTKRRSSNRSLKVGGKLFGKKYDKEAKCVEINAEYRRKLTKHNCPSENPYGSMRPVEAIQRPVEGLYEVAVPDIYANMDDENVYASIKNRPLPSIPIVKRSSRKSGSMIPYTVGSKSLRGSRSLRDLTGVSDA